jgi:hypothetical protein
MQVTKWRHTETSVTQQWTGLLEEDLAEWSERCTSVPKVANSSPSSGSELTFLSDLLLTARGSSFVSAHEVA